MTYAEVMKKLESLGTAQNRKIYKRHGSGEKLFGVSFANLGKLQKAIKTDHDLAQKLWASGNTDARTLATMIADPQQATERMLDEWLADIHHYGLVDLFVGNVASKTAFARKKMEEWMASDDEWIGQAGWDLLAHHAMKDNTLPDEYFERCLKKIERDIHGAKNRTRHAMNNALIGIGIRNASLQKQALAAAKRIGKVDVDHGETSCRTSDAAAYILKVWQRKRAYVLPQLNMDCSAVKIVEGAPPGETA